MKRKLAIAVVVLFAVGLVMKGIEALGIVDLSGKDPSVRTPRQRQPGRRVLDVMTHRIFVDGRVRIMDEMCSTCVFRHGNLMSLQPGRLAGMVADAVRDESTIVCHSTLDLPKQAVCRGFVDRHATQPLQIAIRLGYAEYVTALEDPPPELRRLIAGIEADLGSVRSDDRKVE